mmetsp:Transcript_31391/g.64540  ORF Transcript_31391/g.64540 Transcript_31391/m.64540 type:complete len:173 (-) Transcript_31391:2987-3505(-)
MALSLIIFPSDRAKASLKSSNRCSSNVRADTVRMLSSVSTIIPPGDLVPSSVVSPPSSSPRNRFISSEVANPMNCGTKFKRREGFETRMAYAQMKNNYGRTYGNNTKGQQRKRPHKEQRNRDSGNDRCNIHNQSSNWFSREGENESCVILELTCNASNTSLIEEGDFLPQKC